jgi:DNA gyrase/topoisomerase IV subunit B
VRAQAYEGLGSLDPEQERSMVAQAVALRRLVRVKLADDADVQQAQTAIRELTDFVRDLESFSEEHGETSYDVLKTLSLYD